MTHLPYKQAAVRSLKCKSHPEDCPVLLEGGWKGREAQEEIQDEGVEGEVQYVFEA